ncbi:hypothetical protein BVRB_011920 [Beta vulgaris subsp. vulgaris]|uniref:BRCT domain-containing protein n=1 Tax=Beta vulgaris subsp. vulgaris TaxID=3555 RepID=A0A0J8DWB4_BETVV|nr:hypothetical protein BVRB_011920 [Beta vulgaris subsp. vulgaris]
MTQVVDVDAETQPVSSDDETQPVSSDDETQPVDLDDETQLVHSDDETQVMELAGETQVMDDYDVEDMDTELLDIPNDEDCECKSDREGYERTKVLSDRVGSIDVQFQERSWNQTSALGVKGASHLHQDDGGSRSESLPSDDVARSSGRGFAYVRTASLRAAGLAARQTASKNADNGSCSTTFGGELSELRPFDDFVGKANIERASVDNNIAKYNEVGLYDVDKSNVARSLVRELFMEEDAAEIGSDDKFSDMSQLPSRDNDVAGLSYIDSQEPGELSQANAFEFIDKFLKVNVFEPDNGVVRTNSVAELVTPITIAKGAQSIAQQASHKSTHAGASIFEWDDSLEDEGGGEFFIKKKEILYGTPKSCPKPRSSRQRERRGSQSLGKLGNEKDKDNLPAARKGFVHSDLKSVNGGEKAKVKEMDVEKKVYHGLSQQFGPGSCSEEALAAECNAQQVDMQNVGIDTQIAAEAMEALSAVITLVKNDSSMTDHGYQSERDQSGKEALKSGSSKQTSLKNRACLFTSGVVTRSRSKRVMKTRRQSMLGNLDVSQVKPKQKQNRLSLNDFLTVNRRKSSETEAVSGGGEQRESVLEGQLEDNSPRPLKRRSLQGKASKSTSLFQETAECIEHHSYVADDVSRDCREQQYSEVIYERKCRATNAVVSEMYNRRKDIVSCTTVADCNKVDVSKCRKGDIQHTSNQDDRSQDEGHTLSAYGGLGIAMESVARRTRSRRSSTRCADRQQDDKGILSSGMLSLEDARQLSSNNQNACSPPAKGTMDGSPKVMQKSSNPADITPATLKTPTNAASPICTGDGYHTPSSRKSLSLNKELISLIASEQRCSSPFKSLRQRKDMTNVRVLFSQHLDDNIIRQQKKILSRLGVSVASSISEATHFVADMFVRTRNMLDAIANAKPVVTHLWLESCGQANCFIYEKDYILRDAKKEKELGFNMPRSLALASHHPLLEGKRVLITPNVKPGKEIISSLVKAVHGQAVERLGRSFSNYDDLLVLSCEEDFGVCVPLLEKGFAVYSSELLLTGIITQRLEYERYRLFVAHVKKTRSTLWLKKGEEKFLPVTRAK